MAKKKTGGANESKWVREPEAAPDGKPFCDVAYEQRCHSEPLELLGITFEPGQIVTYRRPQDVPTEFFMHDDLKLTGVMFGVCRIDPMFRYTPLTLFAYEALKAGVAEPEVEPEVVADSDQSGPGMQKVAELTEKEPEPEGGE